MVVRLGHWDDGHDGAPMTDGPRVDGVMRVLCGVCGGLLLCGLLGGVGGTFCTNTFVMCWTN